MHQLLLVENNSLLNENHKFLLELSGFEPVFVKSIDQAINLIEISHSFCPGYDLLIITMSNLLKLSVKYLVKLKDLSNSTRILVVDSQGKFHQNQSVIKGYFETDNIQFCDIERMVGNVKTFFNITG